MSAHQPVEPGSNPGAPSLEGGQGLGAGELAPGATPSSPEPELWVDIDALEDQLREMEEQLEDELENECRWIARWLDDLYTRDIYGSYTRNALNAYEDFAFRYELTADVVESIMRVIDVCKKAETAKLVDYAPGVRGVIEDLEEAIGELEEEIEEDEEEDEDKIERLEWLTKLVNDLQEMTYADFLGEGEEIVKKLNKYGYEDEAYYLTIAVDVRSMLTDTLIDELLFIGEKFNIEDEVEKELDCLVGC